MKILWRLSVAFVMLRLLVLPSAAQDAVDQVKLIRIDSVAINKNERFIVDVFADGYKSNYFVGSFQREADVYQYFTDFVIIQITCPKKGKPTVIGTITINRNEPYGLHSKTTSDEDITAMVKYQLEPGGTYQEIINETQGSGMSSVRAAVQELRNAFSRYRR